VRAGEIRLIDQQQSDQGQDHERARVRTVAVWSNTKGVSGETETVSPTWADARAAHRVISPGAGGAV